ncbi:MAG: class I SAM-dependent methyltransferase [Caldilineaceae bacterium]
MARISDNSYLLLDSGDMQKLERVGPYTLVRPSPQAIWRKRLPASEWGKADAIFTREGEGGGKWTWKRQFKREFEILYSELLLTIKLTDFGHLGLFPEQADQWQWLRNTIRQRLEKTGGKNLYVLNLFGYTGGSTLACSQAGAHVTHVDAAKGVVDWARENAKKCALEERPVRWIVDEAGKFVEREARRGHHYDGIILDPPSFGRGPKGEVFKIEKDLIPLLEGCGQLLSNDALFVLYSCHTPGFTPLTLQNQLAEVVKGHQGKIEAGEMTVAEDGKRVLPSGTFARWHQE